MDDSNFRIRVFRFICLSFAVLALSYGIILGSMILNIAKHKVLDKELLSLSNEIGNMELNYLSMASKVDLGLSKSMGFKEIKPTFAVRQSFTLESSLSQATDNEI